MPRNAIQPDGLAPPGPPYSPVVVSGDHVFTAGQIAQDADGNLVGDTIEEQTRQVLENLRTCLEAAGSSLKNVLKCTIYITNTAYFDEVNRVYRRYFTKDQPARVFCVVGSWPKKFDVEIDAIAIVDD